MSAIWPPEAFPSRVDVFRSPRTPGDIGAGKAADTLLAHAVACDIQKTAATPAELMMLQNVQAGADAAIYFPEESGPLVMSLRDGDKLVDLNNVYPDGRMTTYRVLGRDNPGDMGKVYVVFGRTSQA